MAQNSTLMQGKRGVVTGVANHQSIAWGIASQLAAQGAELAFGYMEMNEKRVKPLGESIGVKAYITFDATQEGLIPAMFDKLGKTFPKLDFLVHALGFAERSQSFFRFTYNSILYTILFIDIHNWLIDQRLHKYFVQFIFYARKNSGAALRVEKLFKQLACIGTCFDPAGKLRIIYFICPAPECIPVKSNFFLRP